MGEMNTAAISANELVLIMSSIGVLGVIGGWIGEKLNIPDVVIYLILGVLFGPVFLNLVNIDSFPVVLQQSKALCDFLRKSKQVEV